MSPIVPQGVLERVPNVLRVINVALDHAKSAYVSADHKSLARMISNLAETDPLQPLGASSSVV